MKRGPKAKFIHCPKCNHPIDPAAVGPVTLDDMIEKKLRESDTAVRTGSLYDLFPAYSHASVRNALLRLRKAKRAENPEHGVWLVQETKKGK